MDAIFFKKLTITGENGNLAFLHFVFVMFKLPLNRNIIIKNKDAFWKKLIAMKMDGGQALQERYYVCESSLGHIRF